MIKNKLKKYLSIILIVLISNNSIYCYCDVASSTPDNIKIQEKPEIIEESSTSDIVDSSLTSFTNPYAGFKYFCDSSITSDQYDYINDELRWLDKYFLKVIDYSGYSMIISNNKDTDIDETNKSVIINTRVLEGYSIWFKSELKILAYKLYNVARNTYCLSKNMRIDNLDHTSNSSINVIYSTDVTEDEKNLLKTRVAECPWSNQTDLLYSCTSIRLLGENENLPENNLSGCCYSPECNTIFIKGNRLHDKTVFYNSLGRYYDFNWNTGALDKFSNNEEFVSRWNRHPDELALQLKVTGNTLTNMSSSSAESFYQLFAMSMCTSNLNFSNNYRNALNQCFCNSGVAYGNLFGTLMDAGYTGDYMDTTLRPANKILKIVNYTITDHELKVFTDEESYNSFMEQYINNDKSWIEITNERVFLGYTNDGYHYVDNSDPELYTKFPYEYEEPPIIYDDADSSDSSDSLLFISLILFSAGFLTMSIKQYKKLDLNK